MPGGREAAHVDADLGDDDPAGQRADAWNCGQVLRGGAKGSEIGFDLLVDLSDRRVHGIDLLQMEAQQEAMMRVTRPRSASLSFPGEALSRRCASRASAAGSLSPAISASIMARPLTPITSVMTESSLMLASSSVFWSR